MTAAEITLIITLLQTAISKGLDAYTASQLQDMADLLVKMQAQLAEVQKDRQTANADIDARDKALEQDLAKK